MIRGDVMGMAFRALLRMRQSEAVPKDSSGISYDTWVRPGDRTGILNGPSGTVWGFSVDLLGTFWRYRVSKDEVGT